MKQPQVQTMESHEASPRYLAFRVARSSLMQIAGQYAREGEHETARALVALVDERLAMDSFTPKKRVDTET